MTTNFQNLELERGDDEDLVISFFQDDFDETPVPLSEIVDVRFTVRTDWATTESDNSTAVYAASLLTSGIRPFGDADVLLEIPKAVTVALAQSPRPFVYDVEILTAAGKTMTPQKGYIQIGADVGR